MVHCCMTSVRYTEIAWTAIANRCRLLLAVTIIPALSITLSIVFKFMSRNEIVATERNESSSDSDLCNVHMKNCIDMGDVYDFPTALTETVSSEEIRDEAEEAIALTTRSIADAPTNDRMERISGLDSSPSRNHSPYSTTIRTKEKPPPIPAPSSSSTLFDHVIRRFSLGVSRTNPPKALQSQQQPAPASTTTRTHHTNLPVEEFKYNVPQKKRVDVSAAEPVFTMESSKAPSPLSANSRRKLLFRSYSVPVASNFSYAADGIENIVNSFSPSTYTETQTKPRSLTADCLLTVKEFSILDELYSVPLEEDVPRIVREYIDRTNVQLALRWSMFVSACKRSLPQVCLLMKEKHAQSIRMLWRRQLLVQTKRFGYYYTIYLS